MYFSCLEAEQNACKHSGAARIAIDIRSGKPIPLNALVRDTAALAAGAVKDKEGIRWRHSGYDVLARWDDDRSETAIVLRDKRGREWPLGYVDTRLPRIFWLDQPRVDGKLRTALVTAFEEARADDVDTYLVRKREATSDGQLMIAFHQ